MPARERLGKVQVSQPDGVLTTQSDCKVGAPGKSAHWTVDNLRQRFHTLLCHIVGKDCPIGDSIVETKTEIQMKTKLLFFSLMLFLAFGCKQDIDTFDPDPKIPVVDPITFDASVLVQIVDIDGLPLSDVVISLGNEQANTDEQGVVVLKDVLMSESTYLTANRSGFFHASRRFYPVRDKMHFVKVMMLSDAPVATFDANTGGLVQISPEVSIFFSPSSIIDQDGNAYAGSVDIAAQPITADDPDLSDKMPGDLVGTRNDGTSGALASAGMVAVELRGSSGQLLNVGPGAEVDMTMNVPNNLLGSAPSTIPMWYFDEVKGVWQEDGEATLQGNTYVATVSHFTYWNYDAWFPITKWGTTVLYENGEPASQVSVCITILELETRKCSYTNENGEVCGMVASNEPLLMEILGPCGQVLYSEEIGPFSDTTFTGPYTIPSTEIAFTEVSGSGVDCNGDPITNGYALIGFGQGGQIVTLDETGAFSVSLMNCDEQDVTVTIIDSDALLQSLPQTYTFAPAITTGEITACDALEEFIEMEIPNIPDTLLYLFPSIWVQQGNTTITSQDSSGTNSFFYLSFQGETEGTYMTNQAEIGVELQNGQFATTNSAEVVVTYYGPEGDFVQGTFSATLQWDTLVYPATGSFSVKRE